MSRTSAGGTNIQKALQVYQLWAQTYPRDFTPINNSGVNYQTLGQYDKALAEARREMALDPDSPLSYSNLAGPFLSLDRYDEAVAVLQQAKARGIDPRSLEPVPYVLAFLQADAAGMRTAAAQAAGVPAIGDFLLFLQAGTAAYAGQFARASDLTSQAVASAEQAGEKEPAATFYAQQALNEALVGYAAQAREQAQTALQASNARPVQPGAAIALALAGDVDQARKLAEDLAKRFPQGTLVNFLYLPTIRAAAALGSNATTEAIADLHVVSPYELGSPGVLAIYLRGQAYLAAHQGPQAAAEFQKLIDHPGIVGVSPIASLARLGLAHARALSGDKSGARKSYQDFFALWEHADPGIPILRQAKSEYAKLQ